MNVGFTNGISPTKLLIVDDNSEMRKLLRLTFSTGDYEILEAEDGNQAVNIIMRENPQIVLLDVMMPGELDGFAVCNFIKSSTLKYTWVIMLTAKGQQEDIDTGWQIGADFYVTKPFSPLALIELVEKLVVRD